MFALLSILLTLQLVVSDDYHDTLDGIVFEEYSTEQLRDFLHCILDKGPCSDVVASYKKHYPDVVLEECVRCSKCQKHMAVVLFDRMRAELPDLYREYRAKFDPDDVHFDNMYKRVMEERDSSYC
ncbi:allergen Tha p 1-like [Aricia agestis]|uniref:allergen Tha p 1-like n=1 Tax=Aricia agestis TaxID=91739 RepID=UPI001C205084|nr:allergen Tha p 1-like [Aricia agestis]